MFGKLGEILKKSIDKIASAVFVDKTLIDSVIKDLQRALIQADVNVSLVFELSEKIRKAAIDERLKGVEKKEHIIKLLHDELKEMLGGDKKELEFEKNNIQYVMLLGLYGVGKSSTIAKLANYYSKRGFKTAMLGLDVHRPAAAEQLEQLAKQNNLNCFIDKNEKNPEVIFKKYKKELEKHDIILVDTAGRDALESSLIKEISTLSNLIKPKYTILAMSADIGQSAKTQAAEFQKACQINGVIITRMDSSAKGGGALTACSQTKAPVYFITTGEKINDIESFSASSFISRMLGMGDLESLIEKVQSVIDEKQQKKLKERLEEGKLTLLDVQQQIKAMQNIGPLSKITSMIPGLGKAKIPDNMLSAQEENIKHWEHAINSMTPEEIENPELLEKQTSRMSRIAKGSGVSTNDIRSLIKQYKMLKELTKGGIDAEKGLDQKQLQKLARKFGKKMRM